MADGASLIINYDNTAEPIDIGDEARASYVSLPTGGGINKEFGYTTRNTASIDFVMDVNGKKGPNSETINNKYHDIRSFKAARFSKACTANIDGIGCVINIGTSYDPVDCSSDDDFSREYCGAHPSGFENDYWAGAKYACAKLNLRLADANDLRSLYYVKDQYPVIAALTGQVWTSSEIDKVHSWSQKISISIDDIRQSIKSANYGTICVGE